MFRAALGVWYRPEWLFYPQKLRWWVVQNERARLWLKRAPGILTLLRLLVGVLTFFSVMNSSPSLQAEELEAVPVLSGVDALDLTHAVDLYRRHGPRLQISTAPDSDGIVRRIEVDSRRTTQISWAVFALSNPSDVQIDRLLVAPHYYVPGAGILMPDLGQERVVALVPSQGITPERQTSWGADAFLITLDPGAVVTFVIELQGDLLPQLMLWEPTAYRNSVNSYTFFRGIVLGISGLLAIFLSIIVVVRGTLIFPASAMLAWSVLAYVGVDFGFWNRVLALPLAQEAFYRAAAEALLAASLLIFLYTYLNLNRWHIHFTQFVLIGLCLLFGVVGLSFLSPPLAASASRIALGLIGVVGTIVIGALLLRRCDRAFMLIPAWLFFLTWLVASALALKGKILAESAQPALAGGLVLFVLMIGFTVMQHAFAGGALAQEAISTTERRNLAFKGAGDLLWDWDVVRDKITCGPQIEMLLGLPEGTLMQPVRVWLAHVHPKDRGVFRQSLDRILEQRRGHINLTFRLCGTDRHFRWVHLRARPIVGNNGEMVRCLGSLVDVTEQKLQEERLLQDIVRDSMTGLPNFVVFKDRVEHVLLQARFSGGIAPAVALLDIDRFSELNMRFGLGAGDSILTTTARRIARQMKLYDTLCRLEGDRFGLILFSARTAGEALSLCNQIHRVLQMPLTVGHESVSVQCTVGLVAGKSVEERFDTVMARADLALSYAKSLGGNRTQLFEPEVFKEKLLPEEGGGQTLQDPPSSEALLWDQREARELRCSNLRKYQAIFFLQDGQIAGLRRIEESSAGLSEAQGGSLQRNSNTTTLLALRGALEDYQNWMVRRTLSPTFFIQISLAHPLFLQDFFLKDTKALIARAGVRPDLIMLCVSESLVMEQPSYARSALTQLREIGVRLALTDFGHSRATLLHLADLPFDCLHLGKQFIQGCTASVAQRQMVLLRHLVALTRDLGFSILCETCPSREILDLLHEFGCTYATGFSQMGLISARSWMQDLPLQTVSK